MQDHYVPDVEFNTRVRDESIGGDNPYRWQQVSTDDLFAGKKVILFSNSTACNLTTLKLNHYITQTVLLIYLLCCRLKSYLLIDPVSSTP